MTASTTVSELTVAPAKVSAAAGAAFFAICAATYIINAADRMIFPIVLRPLDAEYGFSLAQGGFLATIYLMGLGIGGIITGYLLDRMSRKSSMVLGITVYSAFTLLTAAALSFFDMAFYRVMTGVGEAMQNVALVIAVCAFYPGARTFAIGLIQCALGFGQFIGPRLGAALLTGAGEWRAPFYAFGIAGLIGAAVMLTVSKGFTEQKTGRETGPGMTSDAHLPPQLWNRNFIAVLIVAVIRSFPFFALLGLYTSFLTAERGFTLPQAAGALSLFGIGPFFSPLAGIIADRLNQKTFQIVCLAAMAVAGFLIFNLAETPLEQGILAFIEGVAGAFAYVNGYSLAQRSVKNALIGRVSGYYYAAVTFPAAVSGYLMAKLVELSGWQTGSTVMMTALLIVPIAVSLFIDTRLVTGRGRRLSYGARLLT
jgi:MFS family permease